MALHRLTTNAGRALTTWLAVAGLMAAEHHGTIKSGGLPLPGVTVTVSQADKKQTTTTDENGRYTFPDLADGIWKLEVEMVGFEKLTNEVAVAYNAPSPEWTLKMAALSAITAPKPANAPAPSEPRPSTPATAAAPAPASTPPTQQANAGRGGRGGQNGQNGRGAQANNQSDNGRPSLLNGGRFQRVDVNQSADGGAANNEGAMSANEMADLSNAADNSFTINGSVSRGLDMPQQNDWFGGPGGRPDGMGPGGFGGPGGDMAMAGLGGMGGPGGDGAGGGRGGRGGPGGPGGPGGGRGGFGGPGGPGGPGGFAGGRGGFGG